jgi:hypothetical protein
VVRRYPLASCAASPYGVPTRTATRTASHGQLPGDSSSRAAEHRQQLATDSVARCGFCARRRAYASVREDGECVGECQLPLADPCSLNLDRQWPHGLRDHQVDAKHWHREHRVG